MLFAAVSQSENRVTNESSENIIASCNPERYLQLTVFGVFWSFAVWSSDGVDHHLDHGVPLMERIRSGRPHMADPGFSEMLAAVRGGNADAADRLVRQFEPILKRVIRLRLANSTLRRVFDSSDIYQTILADFFGNLAAGRFALASPEALRNLLVTMARNRIIDKLREEARHGRALPEHFDKSDDTRPPDKLAADSDLASNIRSRLSKQEQWLFDQSKVLNRPWTDIAEELGTSEAAPRMQLTRALVRIRREMEQTGIDHVT